MFGRHEHCKVTLEGGKTCTCDCGDKHGTKFVPGNLNTPIHIMTMKIVEAHKRGERYEVQDGETHEPVIELNYQPVEKPLQKEETDADDTLEELEAKRE